MLKAVLHFDADAFFASVEQAADRHLRGKPVAVGGLHRGIVASASYEARKYGIYTPMPMSRARRLCPKLIVVPVRFELYEQFSANIEDQVEQFARKQKEKQADIQSLFSGDSKEKKDLRTSLEDQLKAGGRLKKENPLDALTKEGKDK